VWRALAATAARETERRITRQSGSNEGEFALQDGVCGGRATARAGTGKRAGCSAAGNDCPGGLCAQFIGNIPINLSPLTTGASSLSDAGGIFCANTGQAAGQKGSFRSDICQTGANSGKPCQANASGQDATNCGAGITCRSGTLNAYCVGGANDGMRTAGATNGANDVKEGE